MYGRLYRSIRLGGAYALNVSLRQRPPYDEKIRGVTNVGRDYDEGWLGI
jgi:hypothetical protein